MPRPKKKLSKQDLQEIEMLAGLGLTQQQIADIKGICVETLIKYASDELKRGKSKGTGRVARAAFEMAISGKYPGMVQFYLRTQGGSAWRVPPHPIPEKLIEMLGGLEEFQEEDGL